jgi:hypothetical protein
LRSQVERYRPPQCKNCEHNSEEEVEARIFAESN